MLKGKGGQLSIGGKMLTEIKPIYSDLLSVLERLLRI